MSTPSMLPSRLAFSILLLSCGSYLGAQDYLVDAAVSKSGDGKSWAKAFKTVQEALKVAQADDEVWIARGTYQGGFVVPPGVLVRGNFEPGDLRPTHRAPGSSRTILDGTNTQRVLTAGTGALLESLQIINGKSGSPGGGGLLCEGTSPIVRDCLFRDNHTSGRGTALYLVNNAKGVKANPRIENCYFRGNGTKGPAGIHTIDICNSKGTFVNIGVHLNSDNGLHFHQGSDVVIQNSYFVGNTGRGICHIDLASKSRIENNLFHQNTVSMIHYQGKELRTIAAVNALAGAKGNVSGNPAFATTTAGEMPAPMGSSPLVDAALDLPSAWPLDAGDNCRRLDGDLDGKAVTDIGPVEYALGRIEITGLPRPGGKIVVTIAGPLHKLPTVMAIGSAPARNGLFLSPWGLFQVDLTRAFMLVPWGATGGMVALQVPTSLPTGTSVLFQNLVFAAKSAHFSNLYDLRIR